MGQLLSSIKHGDPMDPGLLTSTAPTGFYQDVLSEQPGNDVEMPQSDPSSTLPRSSATTSIKNNDAVQEPAPTEADVIQASLMKVMAITGQLGPLQGNCLPVPFPHRNTVLFGNGSYRRLSVLAVHSLFSRTFPAHRSLFSAGPFLLLIRILSRHAVRNTTIGITDRWLHRGSTSCPTRLARRRIV